MSKKYSFKEIKKHDNEASIWIVVGNNVYDITRYLEQHPGGKEILLDMAGTDCTAAYESAYHTPVADEILEQYKIGEVVDEEKKN
ncbi:cytochrome b5 [Holotrichia oblita]|uniref:Cytochrome b5 n=1 Tax=Holotrichia oblita TaxID=644536 RepID=A0ACB9TC00_HOLOL|nr:cytochrome b5 [Holotrichia oblita]